MKSYPIWTDVQACNYKSSKSFGSKDTSKMNINVGTSARNSHELVEVITTRRVKGDNTHFAFSVDGHIIKEMVMCNKTKDIIAQHSILS